MITGALPEYFYWFSIIHNGRNLIKYDKTNELNIFNGFKFLVMILVIFGHKFFYYTMNPISYTIFLEQVIFIKLYVFDINFWVNHKMYWDRPLGRSQYIWMDEYIIGCRLKNTILLEMSFRKMTCFQSFIFIIKTVNFFETFVKYAKAC